MISLNFGCSSSIDRNMLNDVKVEKAYEKKIQIDIWRSAENES